MNNQLEIFKNEEFGEVRVSIIDNEPWFVGRDIAEVLGYSRPAKAILDHVDDEDKDEVPIQDSIGRMQKTPVINESGLYGLVLSSKLPEAKKFKRWVTSEVLPSIRKNGMFAVDELLDNPDLLIATATKLKEERIARLEAEKKALLAEKEAKFQKNIVEGLAGSIELADKQARINQIIRTSKENPREKYRKLYDEFNRKYHMNIDIRHKNAIVKGEIKKATSKLTYICEHLDMVDELYEVVVKVFATDVDRLVQEMYEVRSI
ncbi:MAG: Bro-N domain-containing protein [Clostridium sp.]|uniref:BRO-N domain-containing protein n=1 Tax=Clostridium sp. TaxID=1506 RepID=UPI002F95A323